MKRHLRFGIIGLALCLSSCITSKKQVKDTTIATIIQSTLDTSTLFRRAHVGIIVTEATDTLYAHQAEKYFIPASTTKLFTFYAGLLSLPENLPGAYYQVKEDTLFFWGTGEPTALHPDFGNDRVYQWLRQQPHRVLVYSDAHFKQAGMGAGWAWDDFDADYSAETSALPLYGNVVWTRMESGQLTIQPKIFRSSFVDEPTGKWIRRTWEDNQFFIPTSVYQSQQFQQEIPFRTSGALTQQFLMDTLQRWVSYRPIPLPSVYETFSTQPADTVYRRMLWVSDNFLAEQLLLMCGPAWGTMGSTQGVIDTLLAGPLASLPDRPRWVDGSGLSRYNLQTPRNLLYLLGKLQDTLPIDSLFHYLPSTHRPGTLGTMRGSEPPYIFAKSGSMSGVYNLAGFLRTKTGRLLRFAILTNQFTQPVSAMRREVSLLLQKLYEAES